MNLVSNFEYLLLFCFLKFGRSEKGTKFEKIFQFDVTQYRQILSGRFFQILCLSNVQTLHTNFRPNFP